MAKAFDFLRDHFTAHPLLVGGHLQTVGGNLIGRNRPFSAKHETLHLTFPDGDQTSVIVDVPERQDQKSSSKNMFVMFHGLGGSARSGYNLRLSEKLRAEGHWVARYNHRGCGDTNGVVARKIYHCGSSPDLLFALERLREKYPSHRFFVLGFSLSGAALLNLLGQNPEALASWGSQLGGALAVCPPLDLTESSQRLTTAPNVVFDRYFSMVLSKQIQNKERLYPDLPRSGVTASLGLRAMDELYTAKFGGFRNRSHYYESCSPATHMHQIKVPTVILAANDDPIVCPAAFKRDYNNPNLKILLTKSGGHLGYLSARKTIYGDRRWMDEFIMGWSSNCPT